VILLIREKQQMNTNATRIEPGLEEQPQAVERARDS
jgi:hypothetical protein